MPKIMETTTPEMMALGLRKSVSTDNWLHTSEVLKYFIFPNKTIDYEDKMYPPTYFKNATLGPWRFCWSDPITEFHCSQVDPFNHEEEDTSDVTTSVELSVHRAVPFMLGGCALDVLGLMCNTLCLLRPNPYQSLFFATLANIFAGLANFNCIILYMSSVSKEVYMSKRDERTYNAHRMRSMLRNLRVGTGGKWPRNKDPREQQLLDNDRYHRHTRMNTLRRHSRNIAIDDIQQFKKSPIEESAKATRSLEVPPASNSFVLNAYDLSTDTDFA
uniref:G_PROTEIN_RECEP_F1_2 domain-containing protein n=1 Tax=Globodera pallida TaxID=36090 RepID=A0A183C6B6_GLOPA